MNERKLPLNIPKTSIRKYELAYDKGYNTYFTIIYKLGSYITFQQFYTLYSKLNPTLSTEYIKRKGNVIIKEMELNKFVSVETIGKHKYFYLKASGLAFAIGDYAKLPKLNHSSRGANNSKLTASLMKVEYYLENNEFIESETMYIHLKSITKTILAYTEKYNLSYNAKFLNSICNSTNYEKIQEVVSQLPSDDIIYILWIDILNMFIKLRKQGQTISPTPLHFKLHRNDNLVKLHYVPEVIILDTHKVDYYGAKMDRLLSDLISIKTNTVYGLSERYEPNSLLGDTRVNIIGYGLKLIGSDEAALKNKAEFINSYGTDNINSPFCSISTKFVDLSTYFSYSYRKTDVVEKIDNQMEQLVKATIERILNNTLT